MSRFERTGERDAIYSRFHRLLPTPCRMIDLDQIECCPYCWQPLAIFELARDIGQSYKPTTILTNLCKLANIKGVLTFYKHELLAPILTHPVLIDALKQDHLNLDILKRALIALRRIDNVTFRVRFVYPYSRDEVLMTPAQYENWLLSLHQEHEQTCGCNPFDRR